MRWLIPGSFIAVSVVSMLVRPALGDLIETPTLTDFTVKVHDLKQCPEIKDTTVTLENVSLEPFNKSMFLINAKWVVNTVIEKDFKMKIDIIKCISIQQEDSCEPYLTTVVENICEKMPQEDKSWSEMIKHIKGLNPHCPIETNTYDIVDAPLNMDDAKKAPSEGFYKLQMTGIHKDTEVFCCYVVSAEIKKKKKSKKASR